MPRATGMRRLRGAPGSIQELKEILSDRPVYHTGKRLKSARAYKLDLARKGKRARRSSRGPNKGNFNIGAGDHYVVNTSNLELSRGSKLRKRGYGWL